VALLRPLDTSYLRPPKTITRNDSLGADSGVTWNAGTTPYVLKSEEDVLNAETQGVVTIVKTNLVVNCPVIYTPFGGLLPTAKIIGGGSEHVN